MLQRPAGLRLSASISAHSPIMDRLLAVLLDVDGTLIDSNAQHTHAFVDAAAELGIPAPHFDRLRGLIGMGSDKLIPEAFGVAFESSDGLALDEVKGRIFRDRYLSSVRPTPGAATLLRRLRDDGLRLVVATSAGREDLELLLDRAGVSDLIDGATSASDVEESKPEPDIVVAALRLADVPPGSAIMLGDTPYDVEAAIRAGVGIVAVRTGGWDDASLAGASAIYDDPADLMRDYEASPIGRRVRAG